MSADDVIPDRVVRTVAIVARWFGASVQSIHNWLRDGAPGTRGAYDLLEIARWQVLNVGGPGRSGKRQPAEPGTVTKEEAERRLKLAQAEHAEDRLKQSRGDLIPFTEYERNAIALVESFVSALENLPPKVVPMLIAARGHAEMTTILQDYVRAARIQLAAKHAPRKAEADASDEGEKSDMEPEA